MTTSFTATAPFSWILSFADVADYVLNVVIHDSILIRITLLGQLLHPATSVELEETCLVWLRSTC